MDDGFLTIPVAAFPLYFDAASQEVAEAECVRLREAGLDARIKVRSRPTGAISRNAEGIEVVEVKITFRVVIYGRIE